MEFFMPLMTGIFKARKGVNGNEVAYLPIANAAIQFMNVTTGKQQMVAETDKDGKYSFNIPIGKYTVGAYIKGGEPVFNTICGGSVWEVFANSPSDSFENFYLNPNAGDVDGALLEKMKRLAAQSTQGAIDSQESADQSLANSQVALKLIDEGVWKEQVTYRAAASGLSVLNLTHATMLTRLSDGPEALGTSYVYIRKLKYNSDRYMLFVEEYNAKEPRSWVANVIDGVLQPWQPNGATRMKENGLWDISSNILLKDLFDAHNSGNFYTSDKDANFIEMMPEGRSNGAYISINKRTTGYISINLRYATGSRCEYAIVKDNGVWQPPMQYEMNRIGKQAFTAWRPSDLPTKMTGWYAMNGDNVLLSSRVGQALNSLPQTYKDDWGIKVTGANINVPNWFHADGRGYHPRASLTPGARLEDAMQPITGNVRPSFGDYLSAWTPVAGGLGAFSPERENVKTNIITKGAEIGPNNVNIGIRFDSARVARTASETRGMSLGLLPIIYLGV